MEGVRNASAWLLEDRQAGSAGSAVAAVIEGQAPLLVEVQALVAPSPLAMPRRVAQGLDGSRLALLLAVLERRTGIAFTDKEVFVNLVGGLVLREPALDVAVAAALVSSATDRPLPSELVFFGEVGLLGEVRAVSRTAERVREAAALGFRRVALPARSAAGELALRTVPIASVGDLVTLVSGERNRQA
jgi:DNA repair protein RadA/Sms